MHSVGAEEVSEWAEWDIMVKMMKCDLQQKSSSWTPHEVLTALKLKLVVAEQTRKVKVLDWMSLVSVQVPIAHRVLVIEAE